jgi:plasmid stabilization system protein ParE
MTSIIWRESADEDLAQIAEYVGQFNPLAAE